MAYRVEALEGGARFLIWESYPNPHPSLAEVIEAVRKELPKISFDQVAVAARSIGVLGSEEVVVSGPHQG